MSLILEALKKSEQERRRDKGPDLQTIHQPTLTRAPRRSTGWIWGVALVAVNAAALAFWWQQRQTEPARPAAAAVTPAPAPAPAKPAPETAAATPAQPIAPSPREQAAATRVVPEAGAEFTTVVPGGGAVPSSGDAGDGRIEEVDQLPEDVRNNLPAMTFSFHVFSTNPQQRTIIINNRRMREGDEINAGLQLQQITEDGVILRYAQHRIHISVLSGW